MNYLKLILNLVGLAIALAVAVISMWNTLPQWVIFPAMSLIAVALIVAIAIGLIPAARSIKNWLGTLKRKGQEHRHLNQLLEIFSQAGSILEPNSYQSLRSYVDNACNAVVQDSVLHAAVKRNADRLLILSDWHSTVMTLIGDRKSHHGSYAQIVNWIIRFYVDASSVVNDLTNLKLSEVESVRTYASQFRIVKENYNQHIGRLEQLVREMTKDNSALGCPIFYRF